MGEKMKKYLQEESAKEAEDILAMINADPDMADVHAPEELEAALFAQIDEYENEKSHYSLSEEDKELIALGKVYKKRKKFRKYAAVASIALMGIVFSSVTAMGGPEKVVEVVRRMVEEREHTVVNADGERVDSVKIVNELEAFEQIEKEYGFTPVKMHYMPDRIKFQEFESYEETQYISLLYQGKNERTIRYVICPNYKVGSFGRDIEDELLEEYEKEIEGRKFQIRHYKVEKNGENRWLVEFRDGNVYYFLQICNLDEYEINEIIDKLYFAN